MVLGTIVKIILSIQAIIGIVAGLMIFLTPLALTESTGLQITSEISIIGAFVIGFQVFILIGLTKLHE